MLGFGYCLIVCWLFCFLCFTSFVSLTAYTEDEPYFRHGFNRSLLDVYHCLAYTELLAILACVSQKTRKLYGPEKPFVKLRPAYSVKLVFLYVVKGIKIKITAKFCDTEHFRFEDTKRISSPGEKWGNLKRKAIAVWEKRRIIIATYLRMTYFIPKNHHFTGVPTGEKRS